MNKKTISILVYSLAFSIISGLFFSLPSHAESSHINLNINSALEITIPSTVSLPITPTASGITSNTSFSVAVGTNNITGYDLFMSHTSTDLINSITLPGSDTYPTIPTITSDTTLDNIPMNTWGYTTNNSDTYHPITTESIALMSKDHYISSDTTTINLATKVDLEKPSGIYANTFIFTATAHQSIFTVTWNAGEGTVSPTTSEYLYGSKLGTLPIPTREDYNFLGWFTQAEGGEEVTENTIITTDTTYYAHWEASCAAAGTFDGEFCRAGKTTINVDGIDYYKMQDMTTSICSVITKATSADAVDTQISTLVDNRDDKKIYTVAKLLDDNCWMTENLRLGKTDGPIALTSDDTDLTNGSTFTLPAHISNWTASYADAMVHVNNDKDINDNYAGYLYNYYAASAGTITTVVANAASSICPKGWTLPANYTQNADRSYSNLLYKYGVINNITDNSQYASGGYAKVISAPLSFGLTGFHDGVAVQYANTGADYWTSTSASAYVTYYLAIIESNIYPQYSGYGKTTGYAIRCIAR